MSRCFFVPFIALLAATPGGAQDRDAEPPLAGRPRDYSHIVGRYRIATLAEPTEVFVEQPITLKVRILGQGPATFEPRRKLLRIFPDDLGDSFHIEPVPDLDRALARENAWEFVYRLRPKNAEVDVIPGLRLIYYLPGPGRRGYQTSYADPIALVVKPKPPPSPNLLKVVQAPERLYRLVEGEAVLARAEIRPLWTPAILTVLMLVPPLLGAVWFFSWRRLFPDSMSRHQRRRSLAARRAVRDLGHLREAPEHAVRVLTRYLGERLDFSGTEPTPAEVAQFLRRKGVPRDMLLKWKEFWQASDERRFAPALAVGADSWSRQAAELIHALEAEPCLARTH